MLLDYRRILRCTVIHQAIAVQFQLCAPYSRSNAVVVAGAPANYFPSQDGCFTLRIHHNSGHTATLRWVIATSAMRPELCAPFSPGATGVAQGITAIPMRCGPVLDSSHCFYASTQLAELPPISTSANQLGVSRSTVSCVLALPQLRTVV